MTTALAVGRGWDDAVEAFVEHLLTTPTATTGRPLSSSTAKDYGVFVRRIGHAVSAGPWDVDVDVVDTWLTNSITSDHSRQKARLALRSFYGWAVRHGHTDRPPIDLPAQGLGAGWDLAIGSFRDHLGTTDRSPATCHGYLKHIAWLAAGATTGPSELDARELGDWMDRQAWSDLTRRKVLVSLRAFFAWAVEHGHAEWSPVAGLPSPENARRGPQKLRLRGAWEEPTWAFLASMRAAKRQEGTLDVRRRYLRLLSETAADPWAVTQQQLELWLANPDWAPETARAARSVARRFYAWAVADGRIAQSPAAGLSSIRVPRKLPRPIPDGPLREALGRADDRTRLMLMLGALAGLRRAEIAALQMRHLSETEIFVIGKGGHQRIVPMHPQLWEEIRAEQIRRRDGRCGSGWSGIYCTPHGYLFPTDDQPGPLTAAHVGGLLRRVLPEPWGSHSLRHRFATSAYGQQRDLLAVQQLLGHAKPETTAVYAQVPDGALRTAVLGVSL